MSVAAYRDDWYVTEYLGRTITHQTRTYSGERAVHRLGDGV